jgi:hypothetical protein
MTVFVVNHGIIKSTILLTVGIRLMIKFNVDLPQDWFRNELKWMLAIREQLLTFSALDLGCVHHLPHALPQEEDIYCLQEGNQ